MAAAPQAVAQAYRSNQIQDDQILSIVDRGLNDIVLQIKHTLGGDIDETNDNVSRILDLLENITLTIRNGNPGSNMFGLNNIVTDGDSILFDPADNRTILIDPFIEPKLDFVNDQNFFDIVQLKQDFNDLNYNTNVNPIYDYNINNQNLNLSQNPAHIQTINNRLKNCQTLEYLYLKKHDELFKVFAFTLNLFDKYKYAIKLILFLLKHLVNKTTPPVVPLPPVVPPPPIVIPGPDITVDLPATIIPNIGKLVRDQKAIQDVINTMQTSLNANSNPANKIRDLTTPGNLDAIVGREGDLRSFTTRLDDDINPVQGP